MKWIWLSLFGAAGAPVGMAWGADPAPAANSSASPASSAPGSDGGASSGTASAGVASSGATLDAAALDAALLAADRYFVNGELEAALRVLEPACSASPVVRLRRRGARALLVEPLGSGRVSFRVGHAESARSESGGR